VVQLRHQLPQRVRESAPAAAEIPPEIPPPT
jgi:hypothetical protein